MSIVPTTSTEYIWFGTRAVKFEAGGNTGPQIELLDDSSDFATRTTGTSTADFTGSEWQQFLAFSGTMAEMNALGVNVLDGSVDTAVSGQVNTTGDLRVGMGVEAHNIADISGGGRLVDTTGNLDDADDPLTITGLGKAGPGKLDSASIDAGDTGNRAVFSNDIGFGFIGGSGFETSGNALRINDGESINFEINQGRLLSQASFTVKVLGGGSTAIVIDSDGKTIKDTNGDAQGGFEQDGSAGELNLGTLAHLTKVTINFVNKTIWFNGSQQFEGDATGFFAAFEAGGSKNLTLGSVVGNQIGWSADDLVLATENAPPVAALPAGGIGDEDTEITGSVGAIDPNGDPLTYAVLPADGPANGSVVFNDDGSYVYTPNANFNGEDTFTVTISDGQGGETRVDVQVTVLPVNDAPVAQGFTGGTGNEDSAILGDVNASDVDGDTLAYTVAVGDGPVNGSLILDTGNGNFTYTPNANYNGADSFTVTISDGNGGTTTQVVNITVNPVNDIAVISGTSIGAVTEDVGVVGGNLATSGNLSVLDPDAGQAVFNTTVTPAGGNLGTLTITAAGAWNYAVSNAAVQYLNTSQTKVDSFTVSSLDGSATQTINVTINGANEPVVAVAAINLDNLNGNGTGGYKIIGESSGDDSGTSVASIADLNGDGKAEVIIGTPDDDDSEGDDGGAAYVVWGKGTTGEINLDDVENGTGGFKIIAETGDDAVGFSVASIGDLDGDGKDDILVGAVGASQGSDDGGAVYVVFGKGTTGEINLDNVAAGTGGFKIYGESDDDGAGYSVASAGDVNNDGKADIVLGAIGDDDGGNNAGAVYVVFGKSTTTAVNLDNLNGTGTGGFKIIGETNNDFAGFSVAAAGDQNGDGFADIVLGAIDNDSGGSNAGAAYVVFGKSTTAEINLDNVAAGTGGFKITGETGSDNAGWDVASIGDLNGDGKREILIGATGAPSEDSDDGGAVYVVWGKSTTGAVNLDNVAAGTGGFKIIAEDDNDDVGYSVASIGDLNGDGLDEILIGAIDDNNAGGDDAGAVYVVWGKSSTTTVDLDLVAAGTGGFKIFGESEDDFAGYDVAAINDLNGDGRQEILLTAIGDDDGGSNAGATYVVFSSADWIGAV